MWKCPKCAKKVDDEFEICWACGTSKDGVEDPHFLDEATTEDRFVPESDIPAHWVTIAKCPKVSQAHAMRIQLESEGIPVTMFDEMSTTTMFGLQTRVSVEVQVPDEFAERAREILHIIEDEMDDDQDQESAAEDDEETSETSEGSDEFGENDAPNDGIVDLNQTPPVKQDDRIVDKQEGEA